MGKQGKRLDGARMRSDLRIWSPRWDSNPRPFDDEATDHRLINGTGRIPAAQSGSASIRSSPEGCSSIDWMIIGMIKA